MRSINSPQTILEMQNYMSELCLAQQSASFSSLAIDDIVLLTYLQN